MLDSLPKGYQLRKGNNRDRFLLIKYLKHTYQELHPQQKEFRHLQTTVNRFFSPQTPVWFVEKADQTNSSEINSKTVGCLWIGNAIDQGSGKSYAHILLIYVQPQHRCQGIAKALIQQAEKWAKTRGDRQLGLQVFTTNQTAVNLYCSQGFQTQSLLMVKPLG